MNNTEKVLNDILSEMAEITSRYMVVHYFKGKYDFVDMSYLPIEAEVVFRGTKKEMEIFLKGFFCGRTTHG